MAEAEAFTVQNTPTPEILATPTAAPDRIFDAFVEKVKNGNAAVIVGVYVQGVLALPVIQQPVNSKGEPTDPGFVSTTDDIATQFLYAYIYADGNIGLLAHNYLAGRYFFNIQSGDIVEIIYGDGRVEDYAIDEIRQYQALSPRSPTSNFLDLETGETLTSTDLFYRVYGGDKRVTFQTCIDRDNNSEWGRIFPIAFPSDSN
jgi:hypothetical protein